MDLSEEQLPLKVLSELQLRCLNEPLLPNLKLLEIRNPKSEDVIPFIPLFLSPRTIDICIQFKWVPSVEKIAPVMVNLPKLCPHVRNFVLEPLLRNSTIIKRAASEIFLAWNSGALRVFRVCSPLTEEARHIILQLPNLRELGMVFTEPTTLPDISLPDLTRLDIEFHHGHEWLQAFHGTTLSKLTDVTFQAESSRGVDGFLEAFKDLALATSVSAVLSHFRFYTDRSWSPNYHSLLGFKQLKELVLAFPCLDTCSPMDDETLITLAQIMPKLEILQIGQFSLCDAPGGVTIRGLIALAHYCPGLSSLCIHFQPESLVLGPLTEDVQSFQETCLPWGDCALTTLDVGEIPLSEEQKHVITLTLLRIFPYLETIHHWDPTWEWVAGSIKFFRGVGSIVNRTGETQPLCLELYIIIFDSVYARRVTGQRYPLIMVAYRVRAAALLIEFRICAAFS